MGLILFVISQPALNIDNHFHFKLKFLFLGEDNFNRIRKENIIIN